MTTTLEKPGKAAQETSLASRAPQVQGSLWHFRNEMQKVFDRMWENFHRDPWMSSDDFQLPSVLIPVDLDETSDAITLRADLPGLRANDVKVEISGNVLTISGEREEEKDETRHGIHRHERVSGNFYRAITLPPYVNADKTEAKYDKGVLTVNIPKTPGGGPKRIAVKT